jgi:hypothetical protein
MNSPIIDAAQALAGLLRAADEGGLPLPSSAEAMAHAPAFHEHAHERVGGISLHVGTFAALTDWATWLDAPIDDSHISANGSRHNRVHGYVGPHPDQRLHCDPGRRRGVGMTGPEHYRKAETILQQGKDAAEQGVAVQQAFFQAAQVHATLALAAATAAGQATAYDGDEDHSRSRGWAGVA